MPTKLLGYFGNPDDRRSRITFQRCSFKTLLLKRKKGPDRSFSFCCESNAIGNCSD